MEMPSMKKFPVLAVLIVMLAVSCSDRSGQKNKPQTLKEQLEAVRGVSSAMEVACVAATTGTITATLSVTGELIPRESVMVRPLMDGRLIFMRTLNVGDYVTENEVLAKIDDRDIEDEISQQERQISMTRETLILDENELEQKKKDLEVDRNMAAKGFLNENDLRKSELALKRAEIALRKSRLSLEQEENKLQKISRQREKVPIRAPISGMVVLASHLKSQSASDDLLREDIMALDGKLVGASTELFGIFSRSEFHALCLLNGKDKAKVQAGQKAVITVVSHKVMDVPGEVISVSQLQDVKSHAYKVWIRLDEAHESFTSGLFVRAAIELQRSDENIVVPRKVLKERDNKYFVQLAELNKVVDRDVTPGIINNTAAEIVSGLKRGEWLITVENILTAGQVIKPLLPETPNPTPTPAVAPMVPNNPDFLMMQ